MALRFPWGWYRPLGAFLDISGFKRGGVGAGIVLFVTKKIGVTITFGEASCYRYSACVGLLCQLLNVLPDIQTLNVSFDTW